MCTANINSNHHNLEKSVAFGEVVCYPDQNQQTPNKKMIMSKENVKKFYEAMEQNAETQEK